MYDINAYQKENASIVNDSESVLDGNMAIIDAQHAVELLFVDDSLPVLGIQRMNSGPSGKFYFTGDIESDAVTELYYSLIRNRNVEEFLSLFA